MGIVKTFREFINESAWGEMRRRSTGISKRAEDIIRLEDKYKSKFDITEHAGRFVSYGAGSVVENGEKLILISYDTQSLLDFDDSESVQHDLYFRYKTTDDGLLDDVEFVRMEKRNPMSGRIIEE